ncbi:hypothetical protein VNO78_15996 [Psophocarpus tetragonolobus]|uniref:Uncharacterized protein n=1 Tax=Psophocarpus tetragonolobus TaxID=3891 RepID=A0AAN9SKD7_PSOTE
MLPGLSYQFSLHILLRVCVLHRGRRARFCCCFFVMFKSLNCFPKNPVVRLNRLSSIYDALASDSLNVTLVEHIIYIQEIGIYCMIRTMCVLKIII